MANRQRRAKAPPHPTEHDPRPGAYGRTRALREILDDPGYLQFKQSIGEPLATSERDRLDAERPKADGGAA